MQFEWDGQKALINVRKHGVSFDDAATVFNNPLALIFADDSHSNEEQRELIIGHSAIGQLLIVVFTERNDDIIRIISAREVTNRERRDYEENTQI